MTRLLSGKAISDERTPLLRARAGALAARGAQPALAVVRVGARDDDMAYERSVIKKAETIGVAVRPVPLRSETSEAELISELQRLAEDDSVHGILLFLPLPEGIDKHTVLAAIPPEKDVDGVTAGSIAAIYEGRTSATYAEAEDKDEGEGGGAAFAPCTAEAVIAILNYYGIDPGGKTAVVIGRSTVIGKPVGMLLLDLNATVVLCHSKTENLAEQARRADILIACAGIAKDGPGTGITAEYLKEGQTVIDVAIHTDDEGGLYGDVDADAAMRIAADYTPVPGGVGSVTTLILLEHVIRAAENLSVGR
ncbi:MAG: bifunctional 5,10-methylenetetrahydrofolate dehydrogenase/5,10-methenyltetrahydrofolate cyclohydrolase [Clostridiales Family XIII bacterium]|jgi:methylenetetrahydrofolate dehydrogenase (NADP+)/methenyltetrahydrofolate cyclohydrolase|nr:bifunctional 5,10-methylenetetrahydrofolate dehydrogenase/5,10-methenyltetrahydrofolate cyclohydrolase [Clostridiales Family XIII bacterium]